MTNARVNAFIFRGDRLQFMTESPLSDLTNAKRDAMLNAGRRTKSKVKLTAQTRVRSEIHVKCQPSGLKPNDRNAVTQAVVSNA